MTQADFVRWFQQPHLTGYQAVACAAVTLAASLAARLAADGIVNGCEFTFYLPAVLICAVLLRWWQAAAVAIGAVSLHGLVFMGSPAHFLDSTCFQSTGGMFLLSSALIIGITGLIRRTLARQRDPENGSGGIVFSLEMGEVWASWYGSGLPVRLGDRNRVEMMMSDFLAQSELGKRLDSNSH